MNKQGTSNQPKLIKTTLRIYFEGHMGKGVFGKIKCSKNIHPDGFIDIDSVNPNDWTISNNGRTFFCTPDETVYLIPKSDAVKKRINTSCIDEVRSILFDVSTSRITDNQEILTNILKCKNLLDVFLVEEMK
jgi:hypothetical protein